MKPGIVLPTSGPLAGAAHITRVAQDVKRLGYDSLRTCERLLRAELIKLARRRPC